MLRDDLDALCQKWNIKSRGVVRSVPTRWNSVAMTSRRTIELEVPLNELEVPLNELVGKAAHNTSRGPRLLRFKLSQDEWKILKELDGILAVSARLSSSCVRHTNACVQLRLMRNEKIVLYGRDTPIDAGTGNDPHGNNIWTQITSTNVVAYHYIITCNNKCLLLRR